MSCQTFSWLQHLYFRRSPTMWLQFQRGTSLPQLWRVGGRGVSTDSFDSPPMVSYQLIINIYGLSHSVFEFFTWLQRNFHPSNLDTVIITAQETIASQSDKIGVTRPLSIFSSITASTSFQNYNYNYIMMMWVLSLPSKQGLTFFAGRMSRRERQRTNINILTSST